MGGVFFGLAAVAAGFAVGAPGGNAGTHGGCRVHVGFPDASCTPGAVFRNANRARVCRPGYTRSVRHVPESLKRAVFAEYGIRGSHHGGAYEVDHLISLELGGSNAIENLWPEPAQPRPGFHEKDRVENVLHREVCDGTISLARAQQLIRSDWLRVFRRLARAG
jgi:hypothetical protein